MNIVLKVNIYHKDVESQIGPCLDYLLEKKVGIWVGAELAGIFHRPSFQVFEEGHPPPGLSLIVAFGGDGTVLAASRVDGIFGVPILAVNLGNFGFLTTSSLEEFRAHFERILAGDYAVEERMMLKAEVVSAEGQVSSFTALNDVVLHKGSLARPILIDLKTGEDLVGVFPADGVIISTPTGSTAYSLSAGGPILYPQMNAIAITPICPHTLAVRPLVVPADYPVSLSEQSKHQDVMLTVDGQLSHSIKEEDRVIVTRSPQVTRLVKPFEGSFFSRLRGKLKWGERERK
ncbi:MAG: hypothetical protein A3F83_10030 [Candidatus Glassbacteria bacterium RIFCSPLOWO2_12_FULL_58_11]|uniref:NAD kinase n=1 Tax=Candidatus Glassbacteria bacterium RIFCSPLOWO2_12_FULL_58_11 TaxID=1817867 RepID=A0A1F5Z327_9BACT|nr:MAG: hypothetical protein A3F83_10030 [Candidatus Glassbacteria bacterium RIFCSPLOWO2_12_FULL_58_11]